MPSQNFAALSLPGFCTDLPMIQFDIDKAIINYFTTSASEFPLNFYDIQKCLETVLLKECYKVDKIFNKK